VLQTARGALFCISQRAEHIWEGVSSATTRSRPIINTRDEPHADAERFRRLHVIVGDSNMSEWTSSLKVGTTALLLRMVEEGAQIRDLTLENPIRAIREISHDTTCRRRVRLANGREASALDMQKEYLDKALRWVDYRDDPILKEIATNWEHAITALEEDQSRLETQVDWIAKRKLLEDYRHKNSLSLAHPRIALMDLAYHDVNRRRGLYYLMENRGMMERVCDERDIEQATQEPPQTTRAKLRGEFISAAKRKRRDFTVDWVHLKLNDQAQRTVLCKDPFRSSDERVAKLIASL
jgi:proteasome accessory factor A